MITEIISSLNSLSTLQPAWDQLLRESAFRTPFQTFTWQSAIARNFEKSDDLFIVAIYEDKSLIGLAPLCRTRERDGRRLLRFLETSDGPCDYQGCIIRSGREEDFYRALVAALLENKSAWDEISLTQIPETLIDITFLLDQIQSAGLFIQILQENNSFRIVLPTTWAEYLTRLSPEFRGTLESTARKITKMPDIQLVDLAAAENWQTGLNALYNLHQQRWTAKGEKGAFAEEATRQMHLEIVDQFRQQGFVRLPAFVVGDEILAVNYVYCLDDTHYSYLSAYRMDTEWSKYSLGMQIRRASLVYAIESGVKIYDFLRGDEPYKQRFAAQPAENIDLHIFSSKARLNTFKTMNKLKEYKRLVPAPVKQFLKKSILNH